MPLRKVKSGFGTDFYSDDSGVVRMKTRCRPYSLNDIPELLQVYDLAKRHRLDAIAAAAFKDLSEINARLSDA